MYFAQQFFDNKTLLREIEKSAKEWAHLECDVEFNKKWVHLECDVEFNKKRVHLACDIEFNKKCYT